MSRVGHFGLVTLMLSLGPVWLTSKRYPSTWIEVRLAERMDLMSAIIASPLASVASCTRSRQVRKLVAQTPTLSGAGMLLSSGCSVFFLGILTFLGCGFMVVSKLADQSLSPATPACRPTR